MPVQEMLRRMSSPEITEWMAYFDLEQADPVQGYSSASVSGPGARERADAARMQGFFAGFNRRRKK